MAASEAFSKQFKLKKLLSTVSDDILSSKSDQILAIFSDDIKAILDAFTYSPFLLPETKFRALVNILQPEKQTQVTEQTLDITQTSDANIDINYLCDDVLLFMAQFLPFQSLIKLELTSLRFMHIARSKNVIQSIDDNILWCLYDNLFQHSPFTDWKWSMIIDRFKNIKTFEFLTPHAKNYRSELFTNFTEKFARLTVFSSSSHLNQLILSDQTHRSLNFQQCISNVILNNLQSIIIQNDYGSPGGIGEENMNLILSKAPNIKTVECDELYPSNFNYLSKIENIRVKLISENENTNISDILSQMCHLKSLQCNEISMYGPYIKCISKLNAFTCNSELYFGVEDDDDFEDDNELINQFQSFYQRYFAVNTNKKGSLQYFNFLNCWTWTNNSSFVALCIIQQNCNTLRSLHVNAALFQQFNEYTLYQTPDVILENVTELSVKLNDDMNLIGSLDSNTNYYISIRFPNLKKLCLYMNDVSKDRWRAQVHHQFELHELYKTFIKNSGIKLECLELYGPSVNILNQMFDETFSGIICENQSKYVEKQLNIKIVVDRTHCDKVLKLEEIKKYITIVKDINHSNSCCRIQIVIDCRTEQFATQIKSQKQHLFKDADLTDRKWQAHKYVAWIY